MATYIALLRGINVGKAKRIAMADLRSLLEHLGYTNVSTLLNSGNAVFTATKRTPAQLATAISDAIASTLKLEVPVIVKSAKDFAAIMDENTLAASTPDPSRLLVAFVQDKNSLPTLSTIRDYIVEPEELLIGKTAAYLHCANGILESKAATALLKKTGEIVTTRNWATVLKLQLLASESTT